MKDATMKNDWIDRYNEDELSPEEKAVFEKMKNSSQVLRNEVMVDRYLNEFLSDQDTLEFCRKVKLTILKRRNGRSFSSFLLIAASLLFLITLSGILFLMGKRNPLPWTKEDSAMREVERERLSPSEDRLTDNKLFTGDRLPVAQSPVKSTPDESRSFALLPELESLIGHQPRSLDFALEKPGFRDRFRLGSQVLFSWSGTDSLQTVVLSLMDNEGNLLSEYRVEKTNSCVFKTETLRRGIYYWRITIGGELVSLGRMELY
ncbi:MAG TPA: hypothetical protein PKN12_02480 [Bacteroidales bacterium]|nr:hypothetical protein [Bacteroidales bacterium]HPT09133.1 hypothetical protein [Bacteroidales bacterium]